MAENGRHIAYERLVAYALDPLDEAQAAPIREHLKTCPTCRAVVRRVRAVRELLRVSESDQPLPEALARAKAVFGRQQLGWRKRLGQVLTGLEWYQWRLSLALLLLMLAVGAVGTRTMVDRSRVALPGDRLYAVRRLTEKVALATMFSDVEQAKMHVTLIGTHINDLVALAVAGRYEDIPPSVNDFRTEIDETAVSLRGVANYNQADGIVFVQQAEQSLNDGAQALSTLALAGPPGALPIMRSALEVAVAGKVIVRAQLPVAARIALDLTAPQLALPDVAVTALAGSTWRATLAATATASRSPTAGTPTLTATTVKSVTPVPSPTASATGAPAPTNAGTLTPAPDASATAGGTPRFTPSPTRTLRPTATDTPLPSDTRTPPPTKTDTPVLTDTNTPQPTPTDTPRPTETGTPLPTDTNTPRPTATPVPSDTAVPTDTPIPTKTDVPPPTSTDVPPPTATDVPPPTGMDIQPPTVTDVPPPNPAELAHEANPPNNNGGGGGGGGRLGLLA